MGYIQLPNIKEFKAQVALGTANPNLLNKNLIENCTDPEALSAFVQLWSKTGLSKEKNIEIANILIAHPNIKEKDCEYIIRLKALYLGIQRMVEKQMESLNHPLQWYI